MQRTFLLILMASALVACGQQETTEPEAVADLQTATELDPNNPFFQAYETPFGVPPFDAIEIEHYMPAFEEGLAEVYAEIDAIAAEPDPPTFANTVEGIEQAGELVNKVANVFYNLLSAETNDDLQAIAREVQPKLTTAFSEIFMRDDLFARVDAVYRQRDQLDLRPDQQKLLEDQWKSFTRNGVNLDPDKKEEMKAINEELSTLSLRFGENLLKENQAYTLLIEDEADLAGLPEGVIAQAAELATEGRGRQMGIQSQPHFDRTLPPVRRQPRFAQGHLCRLHLAWQQRQRARQQEGSREDGGASCPPCGTPGL